VGAVADEGSPRGDVTVRRRIAGLRGTWGRTRRCRWTGTGGAAPSALRGALRGRVRAPAGGPRRGAGIAPRRRLRRGRRAGAAPAPDAARRRARPAPGGRGRRPDGRRCRRTTATGSPRRPAGGSRAGGGAPRATWVAAGWSARVDGAGALVLSRDGAETDAAADAPEAVRLELFVNRFRAIAGEMGEMLRRTALSTNVKERLDFSCALLDAEGRAGGERAAHPRAPGGAGALRPRRPRGAGDGAGRRGGHQPPGVRRLAPAGRHRRHAGARRRRRSWDTSPAARTTRRSAARAPAPCRPTRDARGGGRRDPADAPGARRRRRTGRRCGRAGRRAAPVARGGGQPRGPGGGRRGEPPGRGAAAGAGAGARPRAVAGYMDALRAAPRTASAPALARSATRVYEAEERLDDGSPLRVRIEVRGAARRSTSPARAGCTRGT
jgi:5-oxoprolinase (ATP-hydrolysing)